MRIGISITPCGRLANGAAARTAAVAAEQVGYSSLWVVEPPLWEASALDPLAVAVAAGAATTHLRLGLVFGGNCPPAVAARAERTVDELTDGRLAVADDSLVRVDVGPGDGLDEIVAGIRATGAEEVVLGVSGDPSLDEALDVYARIAEALAVPPGGLEDAPRHGVRTL